ncbi:small nuclear ribonucleoprotein Sm D3 [Entomophthora muscae]|uniref:Small nuclear ribonucleoprotein Sm D3 n=1 Tax=Entomophthora muscae TaxID=34485 RepID=A0ACC2T1T8_9FUNG|nr:small nuclear ribonucleoprotein Sm D3 [Entomophthora muscae]
MVLGVPVKLLHEAQGHIITLELTNGTLYRGKLLDAEDNMNVQLREITMTGRDGRVSQLEQLYIRGSHIRYFVVPDMLKNAPMFKTMLPGALRGRGQGRGKPSIARPAGKIQSFILTLPFKVRGRGRGMPGGSMPRGRSFGGR